MRRTFVIVNRRIRIVVIGMFVSLVAFQSGISLASAAEPSQPGNVFSFGGNVYGQNGLDTTSAHTLIASPIVKTNLGTRAIREVSTGNGHSLVLADDGTVFSFGWNGDGQLGIGNRIDSDIATPIVTTNLTGKQIVHLAGGANHSLLASDDGTVFSFGSNQNGQTGLGSTSGDTLVATPINMTSLSGKKVSQMDASEFFSLLLTDDGTVFSFGENTSGRTGLGTSVGNTLIATPIDTTNLVGRAVTQVSAGGNIPDGFSLLVTNDGTAFAFGANANGKTGLGTLSGNTLIATPVDATNLGRRRITQAVASAYHSLLLADDGTVFSFGSNEWGRTGLGTIAGDTLIPTPIDMTNLAGRRITQIAAGIYASFLLADDGTVFSFGYNAFAGNGMPSGNTLIATPITMTPFAGLRVTAISANGHVLLLAVPEPTGVTLLLLAGFLWIPFERRRFFHRHVH